MDEGKWDTPADPEVAGGAVNNPPPTGLSNHAGS